MKKIFLLLCVALLLTACADAPVETTDAVTVAVPATQTTEVAETSAPATKEWTAQAKAAHGAIIADIKQENALIGVAYLGYFEGTESDVAKHLEDLGVKEKYLFALESGKDIFVDFAGGELYLVVPNYGVTLTVNEAVFNEPSLTLEKGDRRYVTTNATPALISCNESEIISNVIITADDMNGRAFTYSPQLSGMDGSLVTVDGVCDISPNRDEKKAMIGTWAKISERVETYIELSADGSAKFSHTDFEGNETRLNGSWFADGLTLYLDLYDVEKTEKLICSGEYGILYEADILTLSLFDGDALTSYMAEQGYDSFMHVNAD